MFKHLNNLLKKKKMTGLITKNNKFYKINQ